MTKTDCDLQSINWLASYPKSGNTWVRSFLRAYQHDAYEPIDVNSIGRISKSDSRRSTFLEATGESNPTLNDADINTMRIDVQRKIASSIGVHQVVKTHNARVLIDGVPLIHEQFTRRVVYVVRNPLDVVDSLADHNDISINEAIAAMNTPSYSFGGADREFVRQYLETWSNHVRSWTTNFAYPLLVLRYEDLLSKPQASFGLLIKFLGWECESDRLTRALKFSSFKTLQSGESSDGFKEVSNVSQSGIFFRRGQSGAYQSLLTDQQQQEVVAAHGTEMRRWSYA